MIEGGVLDLFAFGVFVLIVGVVVKVFLMTLGKDI